MCPYVLYVSLIIEKITTRIKYSRLCTLYTLQTVKYVIMMSNIYFIFVTNVYSTSLIILFS